MSVAPNTTLAQGSGRNRRRVPCQRPNADPYPHFKRGAEFRVSSVADVAEP